MPNPPTAPIKSEQTVAFRLKSQQAMIDTFAWQCCANCEYWKEENKIQIPDQTKFSGHREEDRGPLCTKYDLRPPTKIITIGCESYQDCIPF